MTDKQEENNASEASSIERPIAECFTQKQADATCHYLNHLEARLQRYEAALQKIEKNVGFYKASSLQAIAGAALQEEKDG